MAKENINELIKTGRLITYYLFRDAKKIGLTLSELPFEKGVEFRKKTIDKYYDSLRINIILPHTQMVFPDMWGIIGEINEITDNFLIFFDGYMDRHVIEMNNIHDFAKLVEETIIFDFYIINRELDYLIQWDSSCQILIGAGKAKEWVESLIKRHSK